ncbi:MAG: hypothetical protein KDB07_12200 [Planctomycetes bacterium]|nr:hypothetical protein [Planctomycetota bacterium]
MSISSVSAVSAIRALLVSPIPASGHAFNNLLSTPEVDQVLHQANVARTEAAQDTRRGRFVPNLIPDEISKSPRFSASTVKTQTIRLGGLD